MTNLRLHLRDLGRPLVDAWQKEFAGFANVQISHGDIFSTRQGVVEPTAPVDVRADAIVSPANSFGFMDGGIDAVYTYQLGPQLQRNLQQRLEESFDGELPIGQAVIVPTERDEIPWLIAAPTMRSPSVVAETANAYLALRAALLAVREHNRTNTASPIRSVLCPGLATAVGRMPVGRCARQMRIAWERVVLERRFRPSTVGAAERDDAELLR